MKNTTFLKALIFLGLVITGAVLSSSIPPSTSAEVIEPPRKIISEMPNVIFMIGDGMGPEQLKLASLVEYGKENATIMDKYFPVQSYYVTDNINDGLTDSAAGGTALATGQLTDNGVVSMDYKSTHYYKTILEYLKYDYGYSTGIVTTTEVAHATPAVFGSHVPSREDKTDILKMILNHRVDVYMGGGLDSFYVGGVEGARAKGAQKGYDVATNRLELLELANSTTQLFAPLASIPSGSTNLPYELERNITMTPSIVEMTDVAINVLERKDKPFFLMVEGGRIDHAGHIYSNSEEIMKDKTIKNAMETIMFEKAVQRAYEFAKNDGNTIIVVAADHETGGLHVLDYSQLNSTLPSPDLSRDENNAIRVGRINSVNVTWEGGSHTKTQVRFFGYGSDFGNISVKRTPDVFWAINAALGSFPTVPDYSYAVTPSGDMNIKLTVRDTDMSASEVNIYVKYTSNKTVFLYKTPFTMNQTSISLDLSVPLDTNETYFIYPLIVDGSQNSVTGLSHKNTFVKQRVSITVPTTSTSSSSMTSSISSVLTSSTSSYSSSLSTTSRSIFVFPLLVLIAIPIMKRTKILK